MSNLKIEAHFESRENRNALLEHLQSHNDIHNNQSVIQACIHDVEFNNGKLIKKYNKKHRLETNNDTKFVGHVVDSVHKSFESVVSELFEILNGAIAWAPSAVISAVEKVCRYVHFFTKLEESKKTNKNAFSYGQFLKDILKSIADSMQYFLSWIGDSLQATRTKFTVAASTVLQKTSDLVGVITSILSTLGEYVANVVSFLRLDKIFNYGTSLVKSTIDRAKLSIWYISNMFTVKSTETLQWCAKVITKTVDNSISLLRSFNSKGEESKLVTLEKHIYEVLFRLGSIKKMDEATDLLPFKQRLRQYVLDESKKYLEDIAQLHKYTVSEMSDNEKTEKIILDSSVIKNLLDYFAYSNNMPYPNNDIEAIDLCISILRLKLEGTKQQLDDFYYTMLEVTSPSIAKLALVVSDMNAMDIMEINKANGIKPYSSAYLGLPSIEEAIKKSTEPEGPSTDKPTETEKPVMSKKQMSEALKSVFAGKYDPGVINDADPNSAILKKFKEHSDYLKKKFPTNKEILSSLRTVKNEATDMAQAMERSDNDDMFLTEIIISPEGGGKPKLNKVSENHINSKNESYSLMANSKLSNLEQKFKEFIISLEDYKNFFIQEFLPRRKKDTEGKLNEEVEKYMDNISETLESLLDVCDDNVVIKNGLVSLFNVEQVVDGVDKGYILEENSYMDTQSEEYEERLVDTMVEYTEQYISSQETNTEEPIGAPFDEDDENIPFAAERSRQVVPSTSSQSLVPTRRGTTAVAIPGSSTLSRVGGQTVVRDSKNNLVYESIDTKTQNIIQKDSDYTEGIASTKTIVPEDVLNRFSFTGNLSTLNILNASVTVLEDIHTMNSRSVNNMKTLPAARFLELEFARDDRFAKVKDKKARVLDVFIKSDLPIVEEYIRNITQDVKRYYEELQSIYNESITNVEEENNVLLKLGVSSTQSKLETNNFYSLLFEKDSISTKDSKNMVKNHILNITHEDYDENGIVNHVISIVGKDALDKALTEETLENISKYEEYLALEANETIDNVEDMSLAIDKIDPTHKFDMSNNNPILEVEEIRDQLVVLINILGPERREFYLNRMQTFLTLEGGDSRTQAEKLQNMRNQIVKELTETDNKIQSLLDTINKGDTVKDIHKALWELFEIDVKRRDDQQYRSFLKLFKLKGEKDPNKTLSDEEKFKIALYYLQNTGKYNITLNVDSNELKKYHDDEVAIYGTSLDNLRFLNWNSILLKRKKFQLEDWETRFKNYVSKSKVIISGAFGPTPQVLELKDIVDENSSNAETPETNYENSVENAFKVKGFLLMEVNKKLDYSEKIYSTTSNILSVRKLMYDYQKIHQDVYRKSWGVFGISSIIGWIGLDYALQYFVTSGPSYYIPSDKRAVVDHYQKVIKFTKNVQDDIEVYRTNFTDISFSSNNGKPIIETIKHMVENASEKGEAGDAARAFFIKASEFYNSNATGHAAESISEHIPRSLPEQVSKGIMVTYENIVQMVYVSNSADVKITRIDMFKNMPDNFQFKFKPNQVVPEGINVKDHLDKFNDFVAAENYVAENVLKNQGILDKISSFGKSITERARSVWSWGAGNIVYSLMTNFMMSFSAEAISYATQSIQQGGYATMTFASMLFSGSIHASIIGSIGILFMSSLAFLIGGLISAQFYRRYARSSIRHAYDNFDRVFKDQYEDVYDFDDTFKEENESFWSILSGFWKMNMAWVVLLVGTVLASTLVLNMILFFVNILPILLVLGVIGMFVGADIGRFAKNITKNIVSVAGVTTKSGKGFFDYYKNLKFESRMFSQDQLIFFIQKAEIHRQYIEENYGDSTNMTDEEVAEYMKKYVEQAEKLTNSESFSPSEYFSNYKNVVKKFMNRINKDKKKLSIDTNLLNDVSKKEETKIKYENEKKELLGNLRFRSNRIAVYERNLPPALLSLFVDYKTHIITLFNDNPGPNVIYRTFVIKDPRTKSVISDGKIRNAILEDISKHGFDTLNSPLFYTNDLKEIISRIKTSHLGDYGSTVLETEKIKFQGRKFNTFIKNVTNELNEKSKKLFAESVGINI